MVTNPIQGQWAWLLPPWAVICHRGRKSGRAYRTPVLAFKRGPRLAVVILYGEESVWRCFPIHGWKELVKGGIEVHVTKGNHFMELFRNPELFILIGQYLHRYNQIHIKQLAEVNGSAI